MGDWAGVVGWFLIVEIGTLCENCGTDFHTDILRDGEIVRLW